VVAAFQPVLMSGFGLAMRFRAIPLIAALSAGLNVGLNLWCIPRYGPGGAAWTTLVAYLFSAVAGRYVSQRLWPLPITWRRVMLPLLWAALLAVIGLGIESWLWRSALLPLYPLGIWLGHRRHKATDALAPTL
jgi:Na+-driven multidrug efflux pump